MRDVVLVPPTVEPISLTEAKAHLRSTVSAEDSLVTAMIVAARGYVESYCSRSLVFQKRRLYLDRFPRTIRLEHGPVRGVLSIQYRDINDALQTLSSSVYRVDKDSRLARISLDVGASWPSTYDVPNAVMVDYTAGMLVPFTVEDSPPSIFTAADHGFLEDEVTRVRTIGGTLPGGLSAATNYYVVSPTDDTLQLSATEGGDAVALTSAGTAPNVLGVMDSEIEQALQLLVQYFEQRDAAAHILAAAESLLSPFRMVRA